MTDYPKPSPSPGPSPFDRFEEAMRQTLTVSKSELDKRLAEAKTERAKARAERKAKQAVPASSNTLPSHTASSDRA